MYSIDGNFSNSDIEKWFKNNGFNKIQFGKEKEYLSTQWMAQAVSFKISQFEDFDTFIKSAFGGSILVFEWKVEDTKLTYNCYAPIWLFGIWTIKLQFKIKASYFFKYLKEGYEIQQEFERYLATEP